ncbi:transferase hexapeptide (six repeat-containing protein) [Formosa sp. Hel1_31_208]|uniref:serine acetyltransferase n=1 Tax=Formosa sp. Hel1_31_208 TaxID=1798225 RepID=UPI00087C9AD8|nr:serine acetyltransferase [Formosa sp. Hel1_31_208]SDS68896.1 transferase hexapeptide (six repeat-containing protein) [Formosa sp. Hel1_31_208]
MNRFTFIIKHAYKKLLLNVLYKAYVVNDFVIQADINQTINVRGCSVTPDTLEKKFYHLMLYYPDFAFIFFWRIKRSGHKWKHWFTKDLPCKLFRSTKIEGGMMCYHPFATVINAKSIGKNFQFRNGLTIGNKGNDNSLVPTIGNDVTVGANVVIIGDITIGNHVVIGAGSVVVKDVPSNSIIAGNPARVIKQIDKT